MHSAPADVTSDALTCGLVFDFPQFSSFISSLSRPWSAQKHSIWASSHCAVWSAGVERDTWQMRSVYTCWWCGDGEETLPEARRDMRATMTYISTRRMDQMPATKALVIIARACLFMKPDFRGVQIFMHQLFIKPNCMSIQHIKQVSNAHFCHVYSVLFIKSYPLGQSWETSVFLWPANILLTCPVTYENIICLSSLNV